MYYITIGISDKLSGSIVNTDLGEVVGHIAEVSILFSVIMLFIINDAIIKSNALDDGIKLADSDLSLYIDLSAALYLSGIVYDDLLTVFIVVDLCISLNILVVI